MKQWQRHAAVMALLGIIGSPCAASAGNEGNGEVQLSPLEMAASKDTIDHITQVDIERKTARNLWEALRGVEGVNLQTSAGRNEGTISIRGSNRYQVGLYIDDIPVATAYRNEWDANNILTYGLESIEVSKGYSSPLLISNNNLAGAVNLRTAKPKKEFEATAKYMNFFDRNVQNQGQMAAASVGTKQDLYYLKGTFIFNNQNFFTYPASFDSAPYQPGSRARNSDNQTLSGNIIGGWTPNDDVDVMVGYTRQHFQKGQPFDAAQTRTGDSNTYPYKRFWEWPEYETSRVYANGNFNLSSKAHLKAVAYYDWHQDTAKSYTDVSMTKRDSADKTYDQFTTGGQLTFDYTFNPANKIALSAGYRLLSHKEYNDYSVFDDTGVKPSSKLKKKAADVGSQLDEHITETYTDLGAEYTLKPVDKLTLVFGSSLSTMVPQTLESRDHTTGAMNSYKDGLSDPKTLFNYQVGAFYDLTEHHEVFATFAKKSRFATMRERYMRTNGTPANPDLRPEQAYHYELGYKGIFGDWLKLNSSVYYSDVTDLITSQGTSGNMSFSNLNRATFYGYELGAEAVFNQYVSVGAVFNYMHWNNCTNDDKLTQLPELTSTLYSVITPVEGFSIIPQVNMSSGFYWNSAPYDTYYRKAPGFTTVDLKAVYDINKNFSVEAGVKNMFDQEYAYSAYYPEPGRSFFMGVTATF